MSLFDKPNDKKLSDVYPPGTAFILYSGEYEGITDTSFGSKPAASVEIGPSDRSGTPERFRVFGTLAEQVRNIEAGDLPQLVKIAKDGQRNIWVPMTVGEVAVSGDAESGPDF